jgi:hypothetical protein
MKVLLFLLLFCFPIYSVETLPYSKIEPILQETWDKTYPLKFTKIIKKDVLGKGIMVLKDSKSRIYYLYSFLVFFPRYKLEDGKSVYEEGLGREIVVKLYHHPYEKEVPYKIDLGEFQEKYNLQKVVRWIK